MRALSSLSATVAIGAALLLPDSARAADGQVPPLLRGSASPEGVPDPADSQSTRGPMAPGGRAWGPPPLEAGQHFTVDPVADGVLIAGGASFFALLELVLSTGELKPTKPGPVSNLLSIDRGTVTQHVDPNAGLYSTIGLGAAIGFAMLDPFLSARRDGWDAFWVDAVMYAETISLTETLTDVTKVAVRRPRPVDYLNCSSGQSCTDTNLQLSFFSGHASTVAAIGATATYLAFQRAGVRSPRAWITLAASLALGTFVDIERVRSGEHFPTDVIAASMAGTMMGVLVPHLHRHVQEAPTIWIGFAPGKGGASVTAGGRF